MVAALGLLVALTPLYILPVCEFAGKSAMNCGFMGRAEVFIGLITLSVGVGLLLSKGTETLRWMMPAVFVSALSVIFMPHLLGYCPSSQMPCHYGTVPMLHFLGGLLALGALAGFALSFRGYRALSA